MISLTGNHDRGLHNQATLWIPTHSSLANSSHYVTTAHRIPQLGKVSFVKSQVECEFIVFRVSIHLDVSSWSVKSSQELNVDVFYSQSHVSIYLYWCLYEVNCRWHTEIKLLGMVFERWLVRDNLLRIPAMVLCHDSSESSWKSTSHLWLRNCRTNLQSDTVIDASCFSTWWCIVSP